MTKLLKDISWNVNEDTYRNDEALSYSTLAKFSREGFNKLDTLFEKVDSPSLTFGSAVDALITGNQEEFDSRFMVADFPPISDSVLKVVKAAFTKFSSDYTSLQDIPTNEIITLTEECSYQLNWKPETRVKVIREQGSEYYSLLAIAGDRKILDTATKEQIDNAVNALKTSEATEFYFRDNEGDIRFLREYQLKFKSILNGIDYRCMADLIVVDYNDKKIYPVDLKTSSHAEWDFFESFLQWSYQIQARLYWRIIRDNMDRDEYFKDFELADYTFIVVNKNTLTPLVWKFTDTQKKGTLTYGKNNQIELRDPEDIGKELYTYLSSRPVVPEGISLCDYNNITEWINKVK